VLFMKAMSILFSYFMLSGTIKSKSNLCCDRRPVESLVLVSSSIWGVGPDVYYRQKVAALLTWSALPD
jgi:hypothetical protein